MAYPVLSLIGSTIPSETTAPFTFQVVTVSVVLLVMVSVRLEPTFNVPMVPPPEIASAPGDPATV